MSVWWVCVCVRREATCDLSPKKDQKFRTEFHLYTQSATCSNTWNITGSSVRGMTDSTRHRASTTWSFSPSAESPWRASVYADDVNVSRRLQAACKAKRALIWRG